MGLLDKGNGGLAELEEVVNRYEEQSPLYGFIQYRRRKVILKYIPEGTSRLLQARVTVQFQSVTEKLSPHDTIYSFTQSADLRDAALSSACSLHTATASIKSSNDSLPQRGLAEITEDGSESRVDTVKGGVVLSGTARDEEQSSGADAQTRSEKVNGYTSADRIHHRSTSATTQISFRPRTTSNTDKPLPPPPPPFEDHNHEDRDLGSILDYGGHNTRPSMDGRFSSNSTRPSTKDLYDAYGYKKKAKTGPRPSTDSAGAPNNSDPRPNEFRPVSTLPAGLRMPSRKAVPARPGSRQAQGSPPTETSFAINFNPSAQANSPDSMTPKKAATAAVAPIHVLDQNRPMSNNGLKTPKMPEPGSPKMTPEKQRLMKALQLRQKQIAAQNSVNGLGIKSVAEEPDFTKTEIDDSILSAVIDASIPTEGAEPIQIATKDLAKESRLLEDSPISMPETAEEPSTQASSITDEEEPVGPKRQEYHPTSIPTISEHQDLLSVDSARNPHLQLAGSQEVAPEDSEKDVLKEAASFESPKHLSQPSAPTRIEILAADKVSAQQNGAGRELPESERHDESPVTDGQVPNEGSTVTAEEPDRNKQLSQSQFSEGQASNDHSTTGHGPPLPDQRNTSTAELDRNREVQQSEFSDEHDETASTGEISENKDPLQTQSLGDNMRVYGIVNADDQARVTPSQSEGGHRQSHAHPVRDPGDPARWEVPNDIVKPLLVRRSSSSKSITIPSDIVNAHEVPLPPIDEDEEISLSPQRALFREQAATHLPLDTVGESKAPTLQAKVPSQDSDHSAIRSSALIGVVEGQAERQFRSQRAIHPSKRVSSPDQSDEYFLSDDSFMEELKSATLQEAKPVSVSKSPIKPVFSRSESEQRVNGSTKSSRSVSTPVDHSARDVEVFSPTQLPTPQSMPRSFSAQHAPRPESQQSPLPIFKKIGVSSSISQRIKALEQLSSRPTSPTTPNLAPNTSTFLGLRKTSLRTPSVGSDRKNSDFNKSRPGTANPSPSPSPEPVKSTLLSYSNKADYSSPIKSKTATTLPEARDKSPEKPSHPSGPRYRDIQESPPQRTRQKSPPPAEHRTMGPPPLSPLKPPRPRFGRYSSTRSGSSSSNEQKLEPPPTTTRRDSFASIRSKSSRAGSEVDLSRTLSDSSLSGVGSLDGTQDEKKDSRRSRLLKRMSSISSMSRRSIAHALSPGPKEAPIIERQEPVQEAPSTSVDLGDVNVQFPDSLLWKRRYLVIDEDGVLVLSTPKSDNNSKVVTKRYPLSEFYPPYIPDQDRQELPNSVILDFKDGSTLQCACEHLQGQAGLLKALRHAYSTHQSH